MYFLGIDIGAATAKAVVIKNKVVVAQCLMDTGANVGWIADRILKNILEKAHLSFSDLRGVVATGYGRVSVSFAERKVTEITCHARGVTFLVPEARTIIDIGGQDSKGIRVDDDGNVVDFVMNDKCAAGTGRFLEVMARVLELASNDMGDISIASQNPCRISSVCTVFAESEVVSLRAEGRKREDIVAGIHHAIAGRISAMLSQVGCEEPLVLTGGVALNKGVLRALKDELKKDILVPEIPQMTGALGAALVAAEKPSS